MCVLVAGAVFLSACKRHTEVPLDGRVLLEYSGSSGEHLTFKISNGTNKAIKFPGRSAWGQDPAPNYSAVCRDSRNSDAGMSITVGPPFHSVPGTPGTIKVSSGERIRLAVPKMGFHLGERCRMSVETSDGTTVSSGEFEL